MARNVPILGIGDDEIAAAVLTGAHAREFFVEAGHRDLRFSV
jgi:hypothetical protein